MIAADWLSGSVRPDSLRWLQQELHIQKAFHSIGRIRRNFLETQFAVHRDGSSHGRRMRVESKPRVAQRSHLLHRPLHKRLADLPSAKRRTHVEPFHLASAGKREGTQSDTADWLSRHRRQKQLALWRAVNAGYRREFRFKRPSPVLRRQLGLVFAKQVTNLLQLVLAYRFHDLAHVSTSKRLVDWLTHQNTAVDLQHFAGDVSRFLGCQELDGVRHIQISAAVAQRDVLPHALFQLRRQERRHGRLYEPGRHRIHRDVARSHLACHRHGQANQPCFRRRVIRLTHLPDLSKDAGYVDDPSPALLQHRAHHGLDQQERPGKICVDHFVPVCALHAHDELIAGHAGVVYQDVDLAKARDRSFHSSLDLLFAADIHLERRRLSAFAVDLAGKLLQLLLVARTKGKFGSRFREHQGTGTANPLRCSGYQRDPAFHSCHESLLLEAKQDYK